MTTQSSFPSWASIANNLLADVLFLAAGLLFAVILAFMRRRRLFAFFGLRQLPALTVYLSNIHVLRNGSTGVDGRQRSYAGSAISNHEFEPLPYAFSVLNRFLTSEKVVNRIANALFQLNPNNISVTISPMDASGDLTENIILVGGPGYNSYTARFEDHPDRWLTITNNGVVTVEKGPQVGKHFSNTAEDDIGILERVADPNTPASVFITAGGNVNATRGAFEYLFRNWKELERDYGKEAFALCFRFSQHFNDPQGYERPTILFSSPKRQGVFARLWRTLHPRA